MNAAAATAVKFHFSLWAADLGRSVAFYRTLFGADPAKDYPDYAKFELDRPPLVLSFLRQSAPRGATLNHVGLRLPDSAGLVEVQRRLERAGFPTLRQDGVECCYALQTKFWATDPDGVRWEVYTVHGDIPRHGAGRPPAAAPPAALEPVPADGTWTHTTADPFPARLPFPDAALDEVQLLGTFNAAVDAGETDRRLAEVRRVLKPGGRITARALVGDRPYPGRPDFPGLMARVKQVPVAHEPVEALARAGFAGVTI
ncbi:MAG TPA: ArsI/CadI family heavy metal resistance metalloenzyme, partial [Urbifossiella sp.]|nr:ArsI/CadI family heavy metal resistance metalloenzyme [Urbifossiella sp.]